jgi:hypothetical protein
MSGEIIDIPVLTSEETTRLYKTLNRVKKLSQQTKRMQFVVISFENEKCLFSESNKMIEVR